MADRLEQVGFVRRERDAHDRSRGVVHVVPERGLRDVAAVFLPVVRAWQQMASGYSDDELRLIVDFPQTDGTGTPRPNTAGSELVMSCDDTATLTNFTQGAPHGPDSM